MSESSAIEWRQEAVDGESDANTPSDPASATWPKDPECRREELA